MIKTITISILLITGYWLLVAPLAVSAALVPVCNTVFDPVAKTFTNPCTVCDLFILIDNIIDFLVKISFVLAGLFIAWGGIILIVGVQMDIGTAANPQKALVAKRIITGAITGLLIILVSWVVIDTVIVNLANPAAFPDWAWPWHEIDCP